MSHRSITTRCAGRSANTYIANNGYDLTLATDRLAGDKADLFAFGRPFIANLDLVARLKSGAPLADINPATLYSGGARRVTRTIPLSPDAIHPSSFRRAQDVPERPGSVPDQLGLPTQEAYRDR